MNDADVLVVGGGPAGAAAAIRLAEGGARVVLVEREAGAHDKVCGEFVSAEARAMIAGLGVGAVEAGAPAIDRLLIAAGRRRAEAALPFEAIGLCRYRLDEALLQRAAAVGADLVRGTAVKRLSREGEFWCADLADGRTLRAPRVVLAVGKHDLRGHARPRPADADLVGFKTHLALAPHVAGAIARTIVLALFDGGYAGLQPVDCGRADLCLVVRESRFARAGSWEALLGALRSEVALLDETLDGARDLRDRPLAVARIPYGHVHRPAPDDPPALYRVGDQAAVVPSFCGDGMAIALHTGLRAAGAVLAGETARAHHARIADEIGPGVRRARLAERIGRHPAGRAAAVLATALFPAAARATAHATRVPEAAWRDALTRSREPDGSPAPTAPRTEPAGRTRSSAR